MSRTIFKKVSTYTRMGCDNFALDFSYKILYNRFIFIYKNLNITFKLTCSWQYKNATASCRQNLRIFKSTSYSTIDLKLGQLLGEVQTGRHFPTFRNQILIPGHCEIQASIDKQKSVSEKLVIARQGPGISEFRVY